MSMAVRAGVVSRMRPPAPAGSNAVCSRMSISGMGMLRYTTPSGHWVFDGGWPLSCASSITSGSLPSTQSPSARAADLPTSTALCALTPAA